MRTLKIVICFLTYFSILNNYAQDFTENWTGHFSYLDIQDISKTEDRLFAAATNAIFTYDFFSNEITTLSTIDGLSGDNISTILYVEDRSILLIGYDNGLIQVYDETDNSILSVVDILEKQTIPAASKIINHFSRDEDAVYISAGFGVSVFDINQLEFGDSFFIGPNNAQINVSQSDVFEGFIYAASDFGLFRGEISNPNLIDASEWQNINQNNWIGVQTVDDKLYAASSNNKVYEVVNTAIVEEISFPQDISGFKSIDNQLVITASNVVKVFSSSFNEIINIEVDATEFSDLNTAIVANDNEVYIGSKANTVNGNSGLGVLKTTFSDPTTFEEIHPSCPLKNRFFKIDFSGNQLWGTHGGHNAILNFASNEFRRTGISHLNGDQWDNITFREIDETVTRPFFFSGIAVNPLNPNQVYVTSYFSGLLELTDSEVSNFYNENNSTITPFAGNFHLTSTAQFNDNGDLWVMNGRVDLPLNILSNGQWNSFSVEDIIPDRFDENGFFDTVFDSEGNFFMGSHRFGLIGLNKNGSNLTLNNNASEELGIPSPSVKTVAVDRNGQLWLGTDKGLRIVFNTQEFIEGTPEVDDIIVLDNGEASELLFQQFISDIEVDGSNNKWVATLDTGLYFFSSDGQETIFHFTTDNSPLPTNDILDVDIDDENGIIYIATDKGMVSFKSDSSKPQENLENAFVFPNPVRPGFDIVSEKVKIRDISDNVNIKITDIEGNLVAEAESRTNSRFSGFNLEIDGGTALWNGKNLGGNIVASGVYLVMLSNLDTLETRVLKVMVVR